jgi:glucose-6-phosphate 1-dehydrogenase
LADGRRVASYAAEPGVDPGRRTETFVELTAEVDMPRWRGTQFVLRAGKALAERRKLVLLRFRGGGELELGIDGPKDTVLRIGPLELRAGPPEGLSPYANVLLDVLRGSSVLAVDAEVAVQSWRAVAPVLDAWSHGGAPLEEYHAGARV